MDYVNVKTKPHSVIAPDEGGSFLHVASGTAKVKLTKAYGMSHESHPSVNVAELTSLSRVHVKHRKLKIRGDVEGDD